MKTCECGCGQATAISRITVSRRGWKRGEPKRFVQGHHAKAPPRIERIECACGCGGIIEWTYRNRAYRPTRLTGHVTPALRARYEGQRTRAEPNLSGLCHCGCGETVPIARWTNARTGVVKGKPSRFVPGHHLRGMKRGEGRYVNSQGYVLLRIPDHPEAHKGYVLEHRWIMEQQLGRALLSSEAVHHLNGERADNRPENLIALTRHDHGRAHGRPPGWRMSDEERLEQSERMTRWWAERRQAAELDR